MRAILQFVPLLLILGLGFLIVRAEFLLPAPARAAAPASLDLPDPWGRVGLDVSLRAVAVGNEECVVLTSRTSEPRLWCQGR